LEKFADNKLKVVTMKNLMLLSLLIMNLYSVSASARHPAVDNFVGVEPSNYQNREPSSEKTYNFEKGLPKVHEHDNKPPQGFGLIYKGRLVCFYDAECDLGDGWESYEVHKDSEEGRQKALQMGANIISYVFLTTK
jgi:hypothetical protein